MESWAVPKPQLQRRSLPGAVRVLGNGFRTLGVGRKEVHLTFFGFARLGLAEK